MQTTNVWKERNKTINNDHLQKIQRRFALGTVLIPTLGVLVTIPLAWYTGVQSLDLWILLGMYLVVVSATEVGLHRHFAHRSFEAKPAVRAILGILGSMAGQGPVIYWAVTHRHHHLNSDRPDDPHSPYVWEGKPMGWWQGLWHSHVGWFFTSKMTNAICFGKDLVQNPLIVKISRLYPLWVLLGIAIPGIIAGAIAGTWLAVLKGCLWGGLVRMCLGQHATWSIGSVAHLWGTQGFDTREQSRNNFLLNIPTLGGGWHNNHHAFPNSAICGWKWWQIDPAGYIIRLLEKLGLVWDVKQPSARLIEARQKVSSDVPVELSAEVQ
jgi:stearoyl-CoA desaturase (Delta-9 desaturase)